MPAKKKRAGRPKKFPSSLTAGAVPSKILKSIKRKVVNLKRKGLSVDEICSQTNFSRELVKEMLLRNSIEGKNFSKKGSNKKIQQATQSADLDFKKKPTFHFSHRVQSDKFSRPETVENALNQIYGPKKKRMKLKSKKLKSRKAEEQAKLQILQLNTKLRAQKSKKKSGKLNGIQKAGKTKNKKNKRNKKTEKKQDFFMESNKVLADFYFSEKKVDESSLKAECVFSVELFNKLNELYGKRRKSFVYSLIAANFIEAKISNEEIISFLQKKKLPIQKSFLSRLRTIINFFKTKK